MSNRLYEKGVRRERQTVKFLKEKQGFKFATRTPGSRSPFDVIGHDGSNWVMIQVKCNNAPSKKEMDILRAHEAPEHTSKQVWVYSDNDGVEVSRV